MHNKTYEYKQLLITLFAQKNKNARQIDIERAFLFKSMAAFITSKLTNFHDLTMAKFLMLMATCTMNMTMINFFPSCGTHTGYGCIKV